MVPVATIIDCQTLKDFERNIIVGHEKWDFASPMSDAILHTTISRMCRDYQVSSKTPNIRQLCGWKNTLKEWDCR